MARDAKKKSTTTSGQRGTDQLSVPAAVTEVAKAVAHVKAIQPDAPATGPEASGSEASGSDAAPVPQRTRAELKADIEAKRAELEGVLGELGGRLDVGHRVRTAVDEITADPVQGAKKHPKTVVAAAAAVVATTVGVVAVIRVIAR